MNKLAVQLGISARFISKPCASSINIAQSAPQNLPLSFPLEPSNNRLFFKELLHKNSVCIF
jgi:hypothetical protein